jgi:hypothetical protein
MLTEQYKIREAKKAAYADELNKSLEYASTSPLGEHKGLNDAVLDLGHNASQFLLMQNKLFKGGKLNEPDYIRSKQKIMDGVKGAYEAVKNYQQMFTEKMDRYKTDQSAAWELECAQMAEGFGDFSKSSFFVNPTTGEVNIAQKDETDVNGQKVYVMSSNPSKTTTINALNGMLKGKWNKYDLLAHTEPFVSKIGDKVEAIRQIGSQTKAGSVIEVLDATKDVYMDDATKKIVASFKQAETNAIDAMLANDFDRLSLITDYMKFKDDKPYKFVYSEKDAANNPNALYMVGDPNTGTYTPKFSKQQIEDSNQWMRERLRSQYDKKESIKPVIEPTPQRQEKWEYDAAQEKQQAINAGKYLGWMINGTDAQVRSAGNYLENKYKGIKIKREPDGMLVTKDDGTSSFISFTDKDNNPLTPQQFGAAAASFFAPDVNPSLVEQGAKKGAGNKPFNRTSEFQSATPISNINQKYQDFVDSQGYVGKGDLSKTIAQLSQFSSKAGVTIGKSDDGKKLKLKYGNNEVEIDVNDSDANQQVQNFLKSNYSKSQVNGNFPLPINKPNSGGVTPAWGTK